MKSMYYYGYCYYETLPDIHRKWYKLRHPEGTIVLYNKCRMEGAFFTLIELRAIKKKPNWTIYGKAM